MSKGKLPSDEELEKILNLPNLVKHGSNVQYEKWLRRDTWRLNEAALIFVGLDPKYIHKSPSRLTKMDAEYDEYDDILDTALRAEGRSLKVESPTFFDGVEYIYAEVSPQIFVEWANGKFSIPEPVQFLLNEVEIQGEEDFKGSVLDQRIESMRVIVKKLIEENKFNPNENRWPKKDIWLCAVEHDPGLFPPIKADMQEGGFHHAYTAVKAEYRSK